MKFVSTFSIRPGCMQEAASRFLSGHVQPPAAIKLLGRWHHTDLSGGYTLVETDDPAALYAWAVQWADVIEINAHAVVDDETAGAALASRFAK
jgi:hypothetical protein